ncbi:ferritin-like domain-containing protein [Citreimonas salinaria]|uniref:Ferritin-like metal-binding protein YciE n=1 Tax=Citreimonas salinaria TaxID=321339 RepID=A0A1H3H8Y6_9RHOB|nr:Ferritin-like metal-binding protein YciE [Citreimonas salinaria]
MDDLKDLYIDQMQDLLSACRQSRDIVIELEEAAKDERLKEALHAGHKGIADGMEMLAAIVHEHGAQHEGEHCQGMQGLVAEARAHVLEETYSDDDVRDAMIITQYQRMAHYAIAGYGCCKAFAQRLGLDEEAAKIDKHLSHTYHGDETMTELARGGINRAAAT